MSDSTVLPPNTAANTSVNTVRVVSTSVTFFPGTVAGTGWLAPFIARNVAAIGQISSAVVVTPIIPNILALAVADVPAPLVFSPHDTWRPRMKPDGSIVLACRTEPGNHDVALNGITLWTFQLSGFDGALDGSMDLLVKGLPSTYSWLTYGHPEWNAAGDKVIIWAETTSEFQLVVLDGDTFVTDATLTTVTKPDVITDPSYGPDGTIIYVERIGGDYHISTFDGSVHVLLVSSNPLADPTISPNGKSVLYAEQTGAVSGGHPYGQWSIKYMLLSDLVPFEVYAGGYANQHPVWYDNKTALFQTFRYGTDTEFQIAKAKRNGTHFAVLGRGEYPQAVRI